MYRSQYNDLALVTEQRRPKLFDLLSTDETQEEISWSAVLSRLSTHPHEASWFVPGSACNLVPGGYYHNQQHLEEDDNEEEPTVGWTALHTAMYLAPPIEVIHALLDVFPYAAKIESARGDTPLHLISFMDISPEITRAILKVAGRRAVFRTNTSEQTPLDLICNWWSERIDTYNNDESSAYKPYYGGLSDDEDDNEKDIGNEWERRIIRRNQHNSNQWEKIHILLKAAYDDSLESDKIDISKTNFRPLHTAACLGCDPIVLWHLNESTGRQAILEKDENGQTPLSVASSSTHFDIRSEMSVIAELIRLDPSAAHTPDSKGRLPLHLALESGKTWSSSSSGHKLGCIGKIVEASPQALQTSDVTTFLYPFMTAAVAPGCLDTTYRLLRSAPTLASGLADDPPWRRAQRQYEEKLEETTKSHREEMESLQSTVVPLQMEVDKLKCELATVKKENAILKGSIYDDDIFDLNQAGVTESTTAQKRSYDDDCSLEEILGSNELEADAKRQKN